MAKTQDTDTAEAVEEMPGIQKAAVLLLAAGPDQAVDS